MEQGSRVLGIDPGSRVTGFAVIELIGKKWQCVTVGSWSLKGSTFIQRLASLQAELGILIQAFHPSHVAIEDVFAHLNARSALKLGQARGVVIGEVVRASLPIYEYAPRQIKQAVVGKGNASKEQVQAMVRLLVEVKSEMTLDASDALAIALCHGHVQGGLAAVLQTKSFSRRGKGKRSKRWLTYDRKNSGTTD